MNFGQMYKVVHEDMPLPEFTELVNGLVAAKIIEIVEPKKPQSGSLKFRLKEHPILVYNAALYMYAMSQGRDLQWSQICEVVATYFENNR